MPIQEADFDNDSWINLRLLSHNSMECCVPAGMESDACLCRLKNSGYDQGAKLKVRNHIGSSCDESPYRKHFIFEV